MGQAVVPINDDFMDVERLQAKQDLWAFLIESVCCSIPYELDVEDVLYDLGTGVVEKKGEVYA